MVNEWHTPKAFSDAVTSDSITLESLTALRIKRDNLKFWICSYRQPGGVIIVSIVSAHVETVELMSEKIKKQALHMDACF